LTYVYSCPSCKTVTEIIKPASQSDSEELCDACGTKLHKEISNPIIAIPNSFKPDYFYAFGKVMNSKRELKEHLSYVKGETGDEIVEIGNEKPKYKPKRKEYTID
jgi:putative FmdB family regulatory protein